jgi:hypothetical protein
LEPSSLPSSRFGAIFDAASADISFSTAGYVTLVTLDGRAWPSTMVNTGVNVPAFKKRLQGPAVEFFLTRDPPKRQPELPAFLSS